MYCVKAGQTVEETLKKSRFIGIVSPCANEHEALRIIKGLHEAHPDASHIVFAYRILTPEGLVCRFFDAGEPSGTAGKPVFQHLQGKDLVNVVVAVIRYFGGVKLGAGGLTRTYGNVAKKAIEATEIIDYVVFERVKLTLDYSQLQQFEYQLNKLKGRIVDQQFSGQIVLLAELPADNKSLLIELYPQCD
ncbi:MAG: YigZ family protein [Methylicorpusculum sp.]|uniref:IMPACT family protein n=1 Tax=Methylicorpusculum sp. TaxID=2713644 RepID=UPI00271E1CFA|nr:YigZ family protein [Methylicorpusculum sp.]MDO8939040.1 YigZ family protein [Methylicorpusculum sp.]MDP2202943.1 YigZ family protein [Methylicorpusculum sp.]